MLGGEGLGLLYRNKVKQTIQKDENVVVQCTTNLIYEHETFDNRFATPPLQP
jgi:hypothetical protein